MSLDLIPMLLLSLLLMTIGGDVRTVELVLGGDHEAVAAGGLIIGDGNVTVPADASTGGPVHLLGGTTRIAGTVDGDVTLLAGRLTSQIAEENGLPTVAIGHTDKIAWSHTASTSSRSARYRLDLKEGSPTTYLVDGVEHEMVPTTVTIIPGIEGVPAHDKPSAFQPEPRVERNVYSDGSYRETTTIEVIGMRVAAVAPVPERVVIETDRDTAQVLRDIAANVGGCSQRSRRPHRSEQQGAAGSPGSRREPPSTEPQPGAFVHAALFCAGCRDRFDRSLLHLCPLSFAGSSCNDRVRCSRADAVGVAVEYPVADQKRWNERRHSIGAIFSMASVSRRPGSRSGSWPSVSRWRSRAQTRL